LKIVFSTNTGPFDLLHGINIKCFFCKLMFYRNVNKLRIYGTFCILKTFGGILIL